MTLEEMREAVLGRQLDAVTRMLSLFPDKKMTIHDAINMLAKAEEDAQYVCGFIDLSQYDDEKNLILAQLVARGFGSLDKDGRISLTYSGLERAETKLPGPIESMLEGYK